MIKKSVLLIVLVVFSFSMVCVLAAPNGANITQIKTEWAPAHAAASAPAYAGNVSEINLYGVSTTQTWQGYFGNVTGVIQLSDAGDNVMYNWSVFSPQGEVYASTNSTVLWQTLQCFNFTSTGTGQNDDAQAGLTSLYGTNVTQLESLFGINSSRDVDGIDETFSYWGAANGHSSFYTSNLQFDAGECRSTRVYDNAGGGTKGNFEEVLMYEPQTSSVVFAALLDNDLLGFDGRKHDFQMMVLDDGHRTDVAPTTYYFYVELE
jgi:hypothetical protein